MKSFITLIIIFITFNISFAQRIVKIYTVNNYNDTLESKLYYETKFFVEKDFYFNLKDNNSFVEEFTDYDLQVLKRLSIILVNKSNKLDKIIVCDLLERVKSLRKKDTLYYKLNVDSIANDFAVKQAILKETEIQENRIKDIENLSKYKNILNRYIDILKDAELLYTSYKNKIDGKSENIIADILYDDGFSRTYDLSGSVFKDVYQLSWLYDTGGNEKDRLTFIICLWYSYGYGRLFYSIEYNILLVDFGYAVYKGSETIQIKELIEKLEKLKNE